MELVKCEAITGRLLDTDGKPVVDAIVGPVQRNRYLDMAITNVSGEFTVRLPPEITANYQIRLGKRGLPRPAEIIQHDPLRLRVDTK